PLAHPVPQRRTPHRPHTTLYFRTIHPTRRRRAIHALAKITTQLTQHAVHAIFFDSNQGDTIHPGRTLVLTHPLPCLPQDVTPVNTVIQGIETPARRLLGRSPYRVPQFAHIHRRRPQRLTEPHDSRS